MLSLKSLRCWCPSNDERHSNKLERIGRIFSRISFEIIFDATKDFFSPQLIMDAKIARLLAGQVEVTISGGNGGWQLTADLALDVIAAASAVTYCCGFDLTLSFSLNI